MHLEQQALSGPRRRRSYTKQYKVELAAQCMQPHVSIASIALANGLNANLLRRWVEEYKESGASVSVQPLPMTSSPTTRPDRSPAAFIELQPSLHVNEGNQSAIAEPTRITVELPSIQGPVRLHWPPEHADRLAVCLKVLLT